MAERGYTAIADMVIDTIQQCAGMDLGIGGGGDSSGGGGGSSSHHHSGTRRGSSSSHGAERGTRCSTAPAAASGRRGGAAWQSSTCELEGEEDGAAAPGFEPPARQQVPTIASSIVQ